MKSPNNSTIKYVKRYNKFNLQTNCRICLTQSVTTKLSLKSSLKGEQSPIPLVYEALQLVTNQTVPLTTKYPDTVCGMCLELLKISYDLVIQFRESQKKLQEQFKELGQDSDEEFNNKSEAEAVAQKAPVEILIGGEKFNINDLLIVEEDSDDTEPFDGFLKNLGTSVSASFVKKGYKKPKAQIETPSLIIEKIKQVDISEQALQEVCENNVEPITDQQNSPVAENESEYIDEPCNTDILDNLDNLNEQDKDVMESALNLKYKCPYCSKPMASLTRAKIHSRSCMKNSSNVVCCVCNASFELRRHLVKHMKQSHLSDIKKGTKFLDGIQGKQQCKICGKCFSSNGSLFYHMSKHSGKQYDCGKCDKSFYTKSQARSHAQTHSREKTVVMCPICGKGFHYRSGLFYHMKVHTNERNLICSFCPRRFYTRNSLKRHELTHTGARPYACQFCDKKFRSLGEVKKHKLLHTGERPYRCKYCDMGFTQAHNLKMHSMTHSGEFQCTHCSKAFADADILRFHLKNKHQVDAFYEEIEEEGEDEEMAEGEEGLVKAEEGQLVDQESFYITEQYEEDVPENDDSSRVIVTYELRDEILVETVEN